MENKTQNPSTRPLRERRGGKKKKKPLYMPTKTHPKPLAFITAFPVSLQADSGADTLQKPKGSDPKLTEYSTTQTNLRKQKYSAHTYTHICFCTPY